MAPPTAPPMLVGPRLLIRWASSLLYHPQMPPLRANQPYAPTGPPTSPSTPGLLPSNATRALLRSASPCAPYGQPPPP
ncbi:hypothetical protein GBAR_LOCUS31339 [Geodia barretti]|uniref:Uncharacterized protein n=1 Tax=Geodia barretti TaxID=519541 RepID=A0AA35U0N1_GEOBA|nr:hypothetical protein GBAR_LOCUS31339 [Geodia barretti]